MENMTHNPDAVELKPCPFCGNAEPKLGWSCETTDQHDFDFGYYPTQPPREAEWSIECECRFETGGYFSPQIVADLWNTRDTAERDALRREVEAGKKIDGSTSDGYHTFDELYEYRKLYNAALFNEWWALRETLYGFQFNVHKSKRHSDGELCFGGGWFIVQATLPTGQISNHYKLDDWDLFKCEEREQADTYDGHSPSDVAIRLAQFLALEGESR